MGESVADKNKRIRKEALREGLKGREYLRQLDNIDKIVSDEWKTLDGPQIQALKLKADLQFRRLAKVLPDLKATELTGNVDQTLTVVRKTYEETKE